ncbi:helix-turn-helix domain-containing protein [Acerihabitans sp. TG2]|uniref:helix-turn-helix domain-containing protein n=1 Tax=Acerihabitans sp. TG2 TaxID=3096008 RepID=UPI002B228799|nr:helix-turn-helix domain-containing protein [Acerihabitans sp. TG2]MEA9390404.1 helix-turn-helix domain-containing protein [Acerihabitans sp. TG2]
MSIDHLLATRLQALRKAQGLSLEQLAASAGVSKAMISKIERQDSSPSASLLGRLAASLGVSLAQLLTEDNAPPAPLRPFAQQDVWQDPDIGYLRRQVTAHDKQGGPELVEITLPGFARISYPGWSHRAYTQRLWLVEGKLNIDYGAENYTLSSGDALTFGVDLPITFSNPGEQPCRYLLVMSDK